MIPSFESIISRITANQRCWTTLLIGGVLCFIPGLNLIAFGYLYQYWQQIYQKGDFTLPVWGAWDRLLLDGLRFLIVWLLFLVLPIALAGGIGALLTEFIGDLATPAAYLLLAAVSLLAPVACALSLERFMQRERWTDLRPQVSDFARMRHLLRYLWLPCLAMIGAVLLTAPLYGFALFVSHLFFMSYALVILAGISRGVIR